MAVIIVGVVFMLVGVPFLGIAARVFARDRAIARWPRAAGVVTSARLETSRHRSTDKNTGLHSYSTYYTPSVRYTYTVGGESFEGTSIARTLDGLSTGHEAATRIIEKYPPEARVEVLYDPADPKTSHLEARRSVGAIILSGLGLLFFGIGAFVATRSVD